MLVYKRANEVTAKVVTAITANYLLLEDSVTFSPANVLYYPPINKIKMKLINNIIINYIKNQ